MDPGRLPARLSQILLAWACAAAQPAAADGERLLLIHSTQVAGLAHYEAAKVWGELRPGDPVQLEADPSNPHDARAVRVLWRGHMLGYLPAAENAPLAAALAQNRPLQARIARLRDHPNPRERLRIDVLAPLPGTRP